MNPNQQAERLANAYADAILRLSYTYLKNTQDAQDICQTVFVKLLTEPRTFDSAGHERAYILRMAANACKDLLKSFFRSRTVSLEGCGEPVFDGQEQRELYQAVMDLPARYRVPLYLYYYEGYAVDEVGEIMGLNPSTVQTRLARGRAKLKTMLTEE